MACGNIEIPVRVIVGRDVEKRAAQDRRRNIRLLSIIIISAFLVLGVISLALS